MTCSAIGPAWTVRVFVTTISRAARPERGSVVTEDADDCTHRRRGAFSRAAADMRAVKTTSAFAAAAAAVRSSVVYVNDTRGNRFRKISTCESGMFQNFTGQLK